MKSYTFSFGIIGVDLVPDTSLPHAGDGLMDHFYLARLWQVGLKQGWIAIFAHVTLLLSP